MCRTQCVLSLIALYMGLAHSWDIAVSLGDELLFYTDGPEIADSVRLKSHNLTAIAYDKVHNMMLYVDKQSDTDAICGYNLSSMENKCFVKRNSSNIHSIAFDPATDTLFFTDTDERSINWISLTPGSNNSVYGNLLIKMDDGIPSDIAVDSSRRYIYWTNNDIGTEKYMERARFNGSEREVLITWLPIFSLAIDPQTQKIYHFDGVFSRFLNGGDLDGQHRYVILSDSYLSDPRELTVSNDYLYWMNRSVSYKTVWQIPKNAMTGVEPKEIRKFYTESPLGIAANYKIKNQIEGCEVLY